MRTGEPEGAPGQAQSRGPGRRPPLPLPAGPAVAAHLLCLTCAVSAGKLSPAVCKHPFPLGCLLPSASASLARRRRTSCPAWHRAPCGLPRSRPARAVPERPEACGLATGLPPAPPSSLCGPQGPRDPGGIQNPTEHRHPRSHHGTLGIVKGLREGAVSLGPGDGPPLEVDPEPMPKLLHLAQVCPPRSPPPSPGGCSGSQVLSGRVSAPLGWAPVSVRL